MGFDVVSYLMGKAAGGGGGGGFTPEDVLSGTMTLNEVGITWSERSIAGNRGTLEGTESSAGFEGFNVKLDNLTANKQYLVMFTWQTLEGQYFTGEWCFGYRVSNSITSMYDVRYNSGGWTEMPRDLNPHTHMLLYTAQGTTAYLAFAIPGYSDDANNVFEVTDLMVIDPTKL